ncbi:MAG: DNA polymerase III subunit beta [Chloroflexi bacterium]|nr:MAG: DNA polymerase III subunit beta [Chloroflexota bacterium]
MKVSCLQENLAKGLSIVGRAVASRSTLPVLSNVLLATDGDRLKLSANNFELGINCWVGAKIEQEGAITIPARLLADFVNSLPPERIDMELDESTQTLHLRCARFESNIKGIDAQEFPVVASASDSDVAIKLDPESLRLMIKQVVFAAATDESRPVFTGVLLQFDADKLTMAAADGFRLSVRSAVLNQNVADTLEDAGLAGNGAKAPSLIIPARALTELARVSGEQEEPIDLIVTSGRRQILFHLQDIELVSQLIEGDFPDYNRIIPKGYSTRSVLDTANFLKAVKISHLFARDSANIVRLEISPSGDELMNGRITLVATSAELGDNVAEIDASIEGDSMEVAFNAKYLIDVLSIIDSPQFALETSTSSSPGVFRSIGDENFTHVIMPMHIQTR